MIKQTEIIVLAVLAVVCGAWAYDLVNQTVVPIMQAGPDAVEVTGSGLMQLAVSLLGTAGFGGATMWTLIRQVGNFIPASNPLKPWVTPTIDLAQLIGYQQQYKRATTQTEKQAIITAARQAASELFVSLFPDAGDKT